MEPTVEATCREELEFECFCPHKQGGGSCTVLFDFSTRRDLRTVYNRADHKHALLVCSSTTGISRGIRLDVLCTSRGHTCGDSPFQLPGASDRVPVCMQV